MSDIDGIAFTRGPGMGEYTHARKHLLSYLHLLGTALAGCLGVGATAGRALAAAFGKPVVGVHHMVRRFF